MRHDKYLDDRSNPELVISSLVNALNRKEYARAYSYWQSTDKLQPYDQYVQGYANTESVQVKTGAVRGSAGAGNVYYTIPAILSAVTSNGTTQTFAACYLMHLANPDMQAVPPFTPLGIQSAHIEQVDNDIDATAMLNQICVKSGYPQDPPIQAETGDQAYTDDRSGPVQVLRSLVNAVNSRQYGRAYSYWEPGSKVAPFDEFQQGYADTVAVSVRTGSVDSNAGAGQVYFSVPAALVAKTNNGTVQTFVGCYNFHLASPDIQGIPFQPLSIISATIKKVANGSDTVNMMKTACPPL
ncbi:MAG: hypothetical protein M1434_12845 [Chloroflexi bacterium]|nr:hypothetical protein [Chloroflexota bacterium]MCL5275611.1 hypothetical protein [Chloroflexota bacterium]